MDKQKAGLYRKFDVRRTDGSDAPGGKHDRCSYFVLDLTHDKHAIPALRAYAESCREEYPMLANDLESLADGNPLMPTLTHLPVAASASARLREVEAERDEWKMVAQAAEQAEMQYHKDLVQAEASLASLRQENDQLLLDRHNRDGISPCEHYRVFAMPQVHEDGSESPYCMQCNRDELQVEVASLRGVVQQLQDFVTKERALHDQRGMGGQHVGYSPSISPSTLRTLERMLAALSSAGPTP